MSNITENLGDTFNNNARADQIAVDKIALGNVTPSSSSDGFDTLSDAFAEYETSVDTSDEEDAVVGVVEGDDEDDVEDDGLDNHAARPRLTTEALLALKAPILARLATIIRNAEKTEILHRNDKFEKQRILDKLYKTVDVDRDDVEDAAWDLDGSSFRHEQSLQRLLELKAHLREVQDMVV
ncbi:uncharacterized protein SPSK_01998 [Sporothrix schenckii 1099-18]|uniref:Uncharacterized protein n=2 Tax=Sporothrix schenckii TaxID=29908 RepID=U7PKV3_SPOS1|nr:uncharacterized protein SPSK_01998 [Sporothrix schenckii 1099-18]ERS95354.1 hypothetical protein HMPREF1624_08232 [Sporothrix schenckii ATCC 58251]KJR87532.1 hypothetical protein SPSK_01998 [Sporothrix schenckii 1099-18]